MSTVIAEKSTGGSVGTVSAVIANRNVGREEITICNDHATQTLYLQFATAQATVTPVAVAGQGIRLNAAGGSWTSNVYDGPIAAVGTGLATTYTIVEF